MRLVLVSLLALISCCVLGQRFGATPYRAPNTLAPVPLQVMGEGQLTNIAVGTGLKSLFSLANLLTISNCFSGYWATNATFILYTNGFGTASAATGAPIVGVTVALEKQNGLFQPTVTQPNGITGSNWLTTCLGGSNDICPQMNFKAGVKPSVLIVGFTITLSNWSGLSFRGYDTVRIGQSPYAICQVNDNLSDHPTTGIALWVHTPDAPQTGAPVAILDNGEVYKCMLLYDAPNSLGGLKVYQKLTNGRIIFKGYSSLPMSGGTTADNVFLSMHDDHSPLDPTGPPGDIRLSNYWMTTNRTVFDNDQIPNY